MSPPESRDVGRARKRATAVFVAVIVSGLLVTVGASDASATITNPAAGPDAVTDPSPANGLSAVDREVMSEQWPYMELDAKVRELALPMDASPLTGTRIDRANRSLHVYWAGDIPRELDDLRAVAAESGISLVISEAAFSRPELLAASSQVETFAESTATKLAIVLHHDGSGLTVQATGLSAAADGSAAPTATQERILETVEAVQASTGVPITVEHSDQEYVPTTRISDQSPHWGGAITDWTPADAEPGQCTSGFSTYATGDPSIRHMLTAAHCTGYQDNFTVFNGSQYSMGHSDFIAEMFDQAPSYDSGVIRLHPGRTNQPRVYGNASGSIVHTVGGFSWGIPFGGNYCISGAVGVPNCDIVSDEEIVPCGYGPLRKCVHYIRTQSPSGRQTTCHGDSGGPVYYWNDSWTRIFAAGLAGIGLPDVHGVPQRCYRNNGISVVGTAMSRIPGLWVLTG
jgi:trypsin